MSKRILLCFCLLFLALSCTGCLQDKVTTVTPQTAAVCDPVQISGTIWNGSVLQGVWFNGIQDPNAHLTAVTPIAPAGTSPHWAPGIIAATVPQGATSGPLRVKLSSGGWLALIGNDQTLPFGVTGSPPAPSIQMFAPAASPIPLLGGGTTLNWVISGPVTSLSLNGTSLPTGQTSFPVNPTKTTAFTLTASNSCVQSAASTSVVVTDSLGPLTLSPASLVVYQGQSASTTVSILARPVAVKITCAAHPGLTCNNPTINAGSTSASLTVSASSAAAVGNINPFVVTASEQSPGSAIATASLSLTVGREAGSFGRINPTVAPAAGAVGSGDSCSISVAPSGSVYPSYYQYLAKINCPAVATVPVPFAAGAPFNLGGVGFSANSTLAVVFSETPMNMSEAEHVHFTPVKLPKAMVSPSYSAYDNSNLPPHGAPDTPQIWASPDATVLIVTTLNHVAAASNRYAFSIYDLSSSNPTQVVGGTTYATSFDSATVTAVTSGHQFVNVFVDGGATPIKSIQIN